MSGERGVLELVAICVIVVLLSIGGLVWAFATDLLYPHILLDGLLLAMICLLMGGIFAGMLLWIAKQEGWLARLPLPRKRSVAGAPANDPAHRTPGEVK